MIRFACPQCNSRMEVDEAYVGHPGRCPSCGASIVVPAASTISGSVAPTGPGAGQASPGGGTRIRMHGQTISVQPGLEVTAVVGVVLVVAAVGIFVGIWLSGRWSPPLGVGALLGMLMAILASMVSLTAYHSVRRSRGLRRGKQVAAAGLIGGGTLFLVFLIVAVWSFVDYANRPPCEENLQSIWDALGRYADTHEDKFPPKLEDLVAGAGLDRARLTCPAYRVRPGQRTYQYLANLNRKDFPADLAFVYDGKPRSHKDRLIRVLLIGGEIKKVPTADWDAFFAAEQKKAQDVMQMLHQKANPEPHDMFNKVEGEVGSEVDSAAPEAEDAPPETEEAGEAGP